MTTVIEAKNLSLKIGDRQILNSLDLSVEKGAFVCIIGPNGAGKSSLLSCLGGLAKGCCGEVLLEGKPLASMSSRETARRIAWLHQSGSELLPFTVRQFAALSRYPWHSSFSGAVKEDEEAVKRALVSANVVSLADRKLDTLSGGERQRALLAAALAQGTDILFLDEPASFLDYKYQEEMLAVVEKINKEQGITVLCVTHDVNFALHCAGKIFAVKDGSLLWSGNREELLEQNILEQLFETRFTFFKTDGNEPACVVPEGLLI